MRTDETPSVEEFWKNPLFKDVEAFLARVAGFIDVFGSSHIAFPKKGSEKFIEAVKKQGYSMRPIEGNAPGILNRNQTKKLQFYEITRDSQKNKT